MDEDVVVPLSWRVSLVVISGVAAAIHLCVLLTFCVFAEKRRAPTARLTFVFLPTALYLSVIQIVGVVVDKATFEARPALCAFQGASLLWCANTLLFVWFFFSFVLYVKVCRNMDYPRVGMLAAIAVLVPAIIVAFPLGFNKFVYVGMWCDIPLDDFWWQMVVFNSVLIVLGLSGIVLWVMLFHYLLQLRSKTMRSMAAAPVLTSLGPTATSAATSAPLSDKPPTKGVAAYMPVLPSTAAVPPPPPGATAGPIDQAQQMHLIMRQMFFIASVIAIAVLMLTLYAGGQYASSEMALLVAHASAIGLVGLNSLFVLGLTRQNMLLWMSLCSRRSGYQSLPSL